MHRLQNGLRNFQRFKEAFVPGEKYVCIESFFSRFNTESSKNDQAVQADLKPHLLSQNVTAFPRLNIEKRPQLNCLLDTGMVTFHYLFTTSLPLYVPQDLHTRCASFISPQFGHSTIPGTCNLKCVRRNLFFVLDVLLKGTAIFPTSLQSNALRIIFFLIQ